jgi:hypothetical protein
MRASLFTTMTVLRGEFAGDPALRTRAGTIHMNESTHSGILGNSLVHPSVSGVSKLHDAEFHGE